MSLSEEQSATLPRVWPEAVLSSGLHGMKGQLHTMRGFADIVSEELRAAGVAHCEPELRQIRDAGATLYSMFDDMQELTRLAATPCTREGFSARALVEEAFDSLRLRNFAASDAVLRIAGKDLVLEGDRTLLLRVLMEALDNAVAHRLRGAACELEAFVDCTGGHCCLALSDRGQGLRPQDCERMFELFRKGDPRSRGRGVGLTTIRLIMEKHQGRATLHTEGPGRGATLRLEWPCVCVRPD